MHPVVMRTFLRRLHQAASALADYALAAALGFTLAWLAAQGF